MNSVAEPNVHGTPDPDLNRLAHRTLAAVEEAVEGLRFNSAVARIYEFANAIEAALGTSGSSKVDAGLLEASRMLVQMIAPMMPHLAEECWQILGQEALVAEAPWPTLDRSLLVEANITLPVQVNGRKRADITVPADATSASIEKAVLALDAVVRAMEGRPARRVIVVPQRIVNVVA